MVKVNNNIGILFPDKIIATKKIVNIIGKIYLETARVCKMKSNILLFYDLWLFSSTCLKKTILKRSHSSEKCVQEEDNRCARSSMVVDKLRL